MQTRSFFRVAAACLALAACESSTGSEPLQGIYSVWSVDGRLVPASLDSAIWSDGTTYTANRLVGASLEFLDGDSVQYTWSERVVTYRAPGDSIWGGQCVSMAVPYRVRGDRLLLIVEPALIGQQSRLRLDTLEIGDEALVQHTRRSSGPPARLEYAPVGQPVRCTPVGG